MDFFKSILSDDPDPQSPPKPSSAASSAAHDGAWSFGGLIKTLATQSESVIEIYRRDLKEFGSGLQKETAALRDVANRLPAEIDGVLKSTAEIISHGKDSLLLSPRASDPDADAVSDPGSRRYSRFESQLRAVEGDVGTYCSEPEDAEEFEKWRKGFVVEEREGNETVEGIYKRVVPDVVDDETFWVRYYYKVHKLKQQEKLRANLVNRAISVDLDEELSWDVDDDDEDDVKMDKTAKKEVVASEIGEKGEKDGILKGVDVSETSKKEDDVEIEKPVKNEALASEIEGKEEKETDSEKGVDNSEISKSEEKGDSDLSIVSTQPTLPEEEDMGWDEIEEEVGSGDEKREKLSVSPNRADLRKRLSAADDDEDLSWDIEDDDEPVANPGVK